MDSLMILVSNNLKTYSKFKFFNEFNGNFLKINKIYTFYFKLNN